MEQRFLTSFHERLVTCYDPNQAVGQGTAMASTRSSDFVRMWDWIQASGSRMGVDKGPYTRQTRYANSMDLCTWFRNSMAEKGWPKIDISALETIKSQEYADALSGLQTPGDGLRFMGALFLHEVSASCLPCFASIALVLTQILRNAAHQLTHTNQGGKLDDLKDNDLPDGTRQCYGWRCVGALANARNSGKYIHKRINPRNVPLVLQYQSDTWT